MQSLARTWPRDTLIVLPDMQRDPFLTMFEAARTTIDLAAYKLSDPLIVNALIKAAERGVRIRALIQPYTFSHERSDNTLSPLAQLKRHGIQVFPLSSRLAQAHHKFFLIDNSYGVISTGNFDAESFDGTKDKLEPAARDFAIPFEDPELIAELKAVFEHDIQDKPIILTSNWHENRNTFLVWGPETQRQDLLALIHSATESIHIYQQDFTDQGLARAVEGALKRGIKVQIIMTPFPFSKKEDKNLSNQKLLKQAGAEIHLIQSLYGHAKVIVIDAEKTMNRKLYIGSCNFFQDSLDYNRELGIITRSCVLIDAVLKTFKTDWAAL